jgi:hypothetical protein
VVHNYVTIAHGRVAYPSGGEQLQRAGSPTLTEEEVWMVEYRRLEYAGK